MPATSKGPNAVADIPPVPETEIVSAWRVSCDGGEGALGHPRVWLSVDRDTGFVECGYCDKRFVHESFAESP
ncbi:MAG: zinc-finger domain-containing protein [Paracoccaceae bacterium]|nr:zinc-finger domain-containing protein [Paracoccaceae bacterium]